MVTPPETVLPRYKNAVLAVKGLKEARSALLGLIQETPKISMQALEDLAPKMVDAASARTPIRTGRLVSNNKIIKRGSKSITVGNPTPYAGFVEHGTKNMPARPFWTPVIELMAKEYPNLFIKGVKRYMDQRLGYDTTADR